MKRLAVTVMILLATAPEARAADTMCNVTVDVTDTDVKGVNVRSAPGDRVVATLISKADWIALHVTGQQGDWYAVDRAEQIDSNNSGQNAVLWRGRGYVHKSTVGLSGLQQGATIYFDHDLKSRVVVQAADGDQVTGLLGCWNDFYKVVIAKGTGWTKEVCTNQNTTCS